MIKSVCVYCGSGTGKNAVYSSMAVALADYLVDNNMRLVNGGGSIGLMGVMADRMLERGGECVGVIPLHLKEKEVAHLGMTELIVTADMHSRKLTMVDISDAFIAIPGGFGTMDELFETLTWAQLKLHQKPIGILNVKSYFNPLIEMADQMVREGFLKTDARALLRVADNIEGLFTAFNTPLAQHTAKWD